MNILVPGAIPKPKKAEFGALEGPMQGPEERKEP
jgi:hypothetical protein